MRKLVSSFHQHASVECSVLLLAALLVAVASASVLMPCVSTTSMLGAANNSQSFQWTSCAEKLLINISGSTDVIITITNSSVAGLYVESSTAVSVLVSYSVFVGAGLEWDHRRDVCVV